MPREHHINVGAFSVNQVACPLCGRPIEIRLDKKHGKPYCICDPCGLQMFIRRTQGIEKLGGLRKFLESGQAITRKSQDRIAKTQGILAEIENCNLEIRKLKPRTGFFSGDETAFAMRKALERARASLLKQLSEISKED